MPLRYQQGDRVVVRVDLQFAKRYHMEEDANVWYYANEEMRQLCGETVEILGPHHSDVRAYTIDRSPYIWTDEMFSECEEPLPNSEFDYESFDWS